MSAKSISGQLFPLSLANPVSSSVRSQQFEKMLLLHQVLFIFLISMSISILIGIGLFYMLNLTNIRYSIKISLKIIIAVMCFVPNVIFPLGIVILPTGYVILMLFSGDQDFVTWISLIPVIIGLFFIIPILVVYGKPPVKKS